MKTYEINFTVEKRVLDYADDDLIAAILLDHSRNFGGMLYKEKAFSFKQEPMPESWNGGPVKFTASIYVTDVYKELDRRKRLTDLVEGLNLNINLRNEILSLINSD